MHVHINCRGKKCLESVFIEYGKQSECGEKFAILLHAEDISWYLNRTKLMSSQPWKKVLTA